MRWHSRTANSIGLIRSTEHPDAIVPIAIRLSIDAIAALLAAGAKAFGWHTRYRAMFHAQWAMAALDVDIDQTLHDIAA